MKTLIAILALLILPIRGSAQEYVQACRGDLNIELEGVTMLLSGFSNCYVWADAVAGVYNEGATNFFIPGLSTKKSNITQTGVGYQPTKTNLNGVVCWNLDGTDDQLTLGTDTNLQFVANNRAFTIVAWLRTDATGADFQGIIGSRTDASNNFSIGFGRTSTDPTAVWGQVRKTGVYYPVKAASTNFIGKWIQIAFTHNGSTNRPTLRINKTNASTTGNYSIPPTAGFVIGGNIDYNRLDGQIGEVMVFPDIILDSGQTDAIYDLKKNRYGL